MHFRSLSLANNFVSPELIEHQLNAIGRARDVLNRIATHRDKYRAHHDKKYFDDPSKLYEDAPLQISELEELVQTAQNILKVHYLSLFGIDRIMRPVNADDVEHLIVCIQRHNKWAKDDEIFNILNRRDDLFE